MGYLRILMYLDIIKCQDILLGKLSKFYTTILLITKK